MLERVKNPTTRTLPIILTLFSNPFLRIGTLARRLSISYPTAKDDVLRLVEAKILAQLEDMSPKAYYSPEIFNVAYRDDEEL